ncbi:MAG: LemA family protein [Burkholderiaceae bacterium]|nr:LemA family protein [Burkholderiaceae bacterium]
MFFSSVLWLLLLTAVFWAVGAYYRLNRLRLAFLQAFAGLDAHLARALAWMEEYEAAQAGAGAPVVPARDALRQAVAQCADALARARVQPLHAAAVAALQQSLLVLDAAWMAQAQQLPALAVPEGAMPWAQRWEQYQMHNAQAQEQLRLAAAQYNAAIAQFPAQLLAAILGFKSAQIL